ncbi:MAG: ribosome maturation factor RimM [Syntrophales bacterium]|nr:ribosome maturation factor RimM [Syntrophales bacterium]
MGRFFEIGRITRLHGPNGRVCMASFLRDMGKVMHPGGEVFIQEGNHRVPFRVVHMEIRGKRAYMELEGIDNARDAAALVGRIVLLPRERFDPLPEGEYYWQDIIGLDVFTEEGERLGRITAIIPTGAQDVYICSGGAREILLPAIGEVVRFVDREKGEMIVRLLEGL